MGGANIIPTAPHPITNENLPITLGHEFSGTIEEVGEDVSDIKKGTQVAVQPIIYDGTCAACKEGLINCCDKNGFVGLSGWGGGLSDHVVVPRKSVYAIPDNVSLEVAALVEPLAVAWHAVNISDFKAGYACLVLGGGPIGLAVVQTLKARGAGIIIVSEVSTRRREFATYFGADHVLDPIKDDVVAKVHQICGGQGVNIAYDAAGVQVGLDTAILAIRARGLLVMIAVWEKTATITPNQLAFRERRYQGVATYQEGDFQAVLDAISSGECFSEKWPYHSIDDSASGRLKPQSMVTKKIKMDEVEEQGFKALINDKDNQVKILIEVHPSG